MLVPGLAMLAGLLVAASAHAQTSGSLAARTTVLSALGVTGTADLAFGIVATTSSKVVPAKTGGRFSVTGAANQPVSVSLERIFSDIWPSFGVSFALPANLGHPAVVVGSWTGLSGTAPGAGSANPFVPSAAAQTMTLSGTGRLFLWIGGTIVTTAAPIGSYTSPVVVTVVYN